jgi:hypothetical protein
MRHGALTLYVTGPMLKKNGEPGPSRSAKVDWSRPQPPWLQKVADDADARLRLVPAVIEP